MEQKSSNKFSILKTIQKDYPNFLDHLETLQARLNLRWCNIDLLAEAMTHSSYAREINRKKATPYHIPWNERLEFLGDSVLSLGISSYLINCATDLAEGDLSKIRASLVNEETLAQIACDIQLGNYLLLSSGEKRSGGHAKPSLLADALEALIGAAFLDGGFENAKKLVLELYQQQLAIPLYNHISRDYKSMLQELSQETLKTLPTYSLSKISGPDHSPQFDIELFLCQTKISAGQGKSKKAASQAAAKKAFDWLGSEDGIAFQKHHVRNNNYFSTGLEKSPGLSSPNHLEGEL